MSSGARSQIHINSDLQSTLLKGAQEPRATSIPNLIIAQLRFNQEMSSGAPDQIYIKTHHFQIAIPLEHEL